ncbi:PqqD family protein [Pajaroellobacter abortibovis]|uniref:PqqD family protein n=1 Tax=Pajaroellobacter abortibovis TaxID=1882918 RepID=UPI0015611CBC|nr:PqqD family protein [Pajaroellobacter abortibovis]
MPIKIAQDVHARAFDEELIILDLNGGVYYALDPIGARIWEGITRNIPLEEIIEAISIDYDESKERVKEDTLLLIKELEDQKLVIHTPTALSG